MATSNLLGAGYYDAYMDQLRGFQYEQEKQRQRQMDTLGYGMLSQAGAKQDFAAAFRDREFYRECTKPIVRPKWEGTSVKGELQREVDEWLEDTI